MRITTKQLLNIIEDLQTNYWHYWKHGGKLEFAVINLTTVREVEPEKPVLLHTPTKYCFVALDPYTWECYALNLTLIVEPK